MGSEPGVGADVSGAADAGIAAHDMDSAATNADANENVRRTVSILGANPRSDTPR